MGAISRYWTIWRISPSSQGVGYKNCLVSTAQEFVQKNYGCQNGEIQAALLSYFHGKDSNVDATSRAQAGLCLRCYVSDSILKICKKIAYVFGAQKQFIYQDLLPFVLDDDGKNLIIVDNDGKTQLILDDNGEARTSAYKFFSIKVLQSYKHNSHYSMSLDNWVYLQTKQNSEIKDFLSKFGFQNLSDWALLNRARPQQLQRLSGRDRTTVEIFHTVYRRDRPQQRLAGVRRCPDPSTAQLQEMLNSLQERGVIINTTVELIKELKQVAMQLRQYDIWSYREPLDIYDPDTANYTPRPDLPHSYLNESNLEQQEILEFLHQQLKLALVAAIAQEIRSRIATLQKSKKYATFAQKFLTGLQLYYFHGLSLKEIAPKLGMTSWDQARRVLNPGELLGKVRTLTVQQLLDRILAKARELGLTKIIPEPDYLKSLAEQIEAFVDEEIFTEAAAEIRAGQSRSMDSFYAQQLRLTLKSIHKE